MFKHVLNCRLKANKIHTHCRPAIGINYFSTNFIVSEAEHDITINNEQQSKDEKSNVNNEKLERNRDKLFKKRDQMLESAKRFKDLNRKFNPVVEPKKKKKPSPELKKAIKLLKFMDKLEKVSQGIDFDQDQEFAKYDNDDDPRIPNKKPTIVKTRRTMDRHLDERNFNLQKPVPRTILKGEQKEIKRARKIIDDDEKHLKDKKPFKF